MTQQQDQINPMQIVDRALALAATALQRMATGEGTFEDAQAAMSAMCDAHATLLQLVVQLARRNVTIRGQLAQSNAWGITANARLRETVRELAGYDRGASYLSPEVRRQLVRDIRAVLDEAPEDIQAGPEDTLPREALSVLPDPAPAATCCCRRCGGFNVQVVDRWTRPNASPGDDLVDGEGAVQVYVEIPKHLTWCEDCGDHTGVRDVRDPEG